MRITRTILGEVIQITKVRSTYDLISNIEKIISDKGMKKYVVAERAGLTKQGFSDILNCRKTFKAEYIPGIAYALGVDVNTLFGVGKGG